MFNSIWQDVKRRFQYGDTVIQLILLNCIVWAGIILVGFLILSPFVGFKGEGIELLTDWLAVPSSGQKLLTRPWTIFTYMFTHVDLFHILFNMYFLYLFGTILANYVGHQRIIPIYVLGGFAGFLMYFVAANLFAGSFVPIGGKMLGASAGVLAVVVAAAHLAPTHSLNLILIGPVQIRYIALFVILLDLLAIQTGDANTGGHLAHLGGIGLGFLFIEQLKRGNDWSIWFNNYLDKIKNFFAGLNQPAQPKTKKQKGPHMAYKNEEKVQKKRQKSSGGQARRNVSDQERIDSILDKIKESGYESLSKEEKEFLFKISKDK